MAGLRSQMHGKSIPGMLHIALWAAFLADGMLGVMLLLYPAYAITAVDADPAPLGLIRWQGGLLLGLAWGAWMARRSPENPSAWTGGAAVAHLVAGAAFWYGLLTTEHTMAPTAVWVLGALALAVGLLLGAGFLASRAPGQKTFGARTARGRPTGGAILGQPPVTSRGR